MSAFMRRLLLHKQQPRSYLVRGAGAQDACVITHLKSPWPIEPSVLLVSVFPGERSSGEMRRSQPSVWRRPYAKHRQLNKFGRSILWILRSGGTTEFPRHLQHVSLLTLTNSFRGARNLNIKKKWLRYDSHVLFQIRIESQEAWYELYSFLTFSFFSHNMELESVVTPCSYCKLFSAGVGEAASQG